MIITKGYRESQYDGQMTRREVKAHVNGPFADRRPTCRGRRANPTSNSKCLQPNAQSLTAGDARRLHPRPVERADSCGQ